MGRAGNNDRASRTSGGGSVAAVCRPFHLAGNQRMSMPDPINPYDSPSTPRPGMSSSTKVLVVLGIGFCALMLVCCGGLGMGGFYFYRVASKAMITDPDEIRRVTNEIVTITIPDSFEPKMAMNMQ